MINNEAIKLAFIKYLMDHPEERFWQAIGNFSNYNFILGSHVDDLNVYMLPEGLEDTFYRGEL